MTISMPPIRYQNYGVNVGQNFGPPTASVGGTVIPISPTQQLPTTMGNALKNYNKKHIQSYATGTLDNMLIDTKTLVWQKYGDDAWTPDMISFVNEIIAGMQSGDFTTFGSMSPYAQKAYTEQDGSLISNLMFKMVEQQFAGRWSFIQQKEGVMSRDPYADPGAPSKFFAIAGIGIVIIGAIVIGVILLTKKKAKKKAIVKKKASTQR